MRSLIIKLIGVPPRWAKIFNEELWNPGARTGVPRRIGIYGSVTQSKINVWPESSLP